jgi:hypothetical protein
VASNCRTILEGPYRFESGSLQQTVRLSPDFALVPGKARVFRHVGRRPGGAVGRDAQIRQHRAQGPVVSLSGDIPVPHCRRSGSRRWGAAAKLRCRSIEQAGDFGFDGSDRRASGRASRDPVFGCLQHLSLELVAMIAQSGNSRACDVRVR